MGSLNDTGALAILLAISLHRYGAHAPSYWDTWARYMLILKEYRFSQATESGLEWNTHMILQVMHYQDSITPSSVELFND